MPVGIPISRPKTWIFYTGILVILGAIIWTLWIGIVINPYLQSKWWQTGDEELLSRKMSIDLDEVPFEKAVESILSELNEGRSFFRRWRYAIDAPEAADYAKKPITLHLTDAPLSAIFRYVSNLNLLKYELEGRRKIVFRELSSSRSKLVQLTFQFHDRSQGDSVFPGFTGDGPHDVVSQLENAGIQFGNNTYANYDRKKYKLVVKNTKDQCELIEAYFESGHIYREPTHYEYAVWMIQNFFASKLSSPPSSAPCSVPMSPSSHSPVSDPFGGSEPDPFGR